jgi:hypothetical protein
VSSVAYAAVTARPQNTAVAAGVVRRQFTAPAVNSERCFVCIIAGTTANVTDATWVLTRGAKTVDGTATWQECTGASAVDGDVGSTPASSSVRSLAVTLGQIVKNNSATHYFIASTAGTPGASEPTYNTAAGATTTDGTCTWTSLGAVGSFSAWGAPHARLANAYATNWGAAGNKFYIADNHAETQASTMSLGGPGTATLPTYTMCVDRTAALPPVEANYNTGATFATTGAFAIAVNPAPAGLGWYQGLTFSAGSGSGGASINLASAIGSHSVFKNCAFILANTNVNSGIGGGVTGNTGGSLLWDNCTVQFGATAQKISLATMNFEWRNTPSAIQGATLPTQLFVPNFLGAGTSAVCRGVDFSAYSGQLMMNNPASTAPLVFEDCKFHASMTRYGTTATTGYPSAPVITVRCDSGATNYKATRDEYSGSQVTETSITRVGGATDGTTPTSDKIVTNAQAAFLAPFRMLPLAIWNEVTGADVTVTVYGTINSASLPLNDEIWMDVQYLGSSGSPIASIKTTSKSHPLATGAAVSSDGSTWNGGGSGAGWSPFKLVATLTSPQPQMKGYIYASVRAAKASATYYIDPLPTLS